MMGYRQQRPKIGLTVCPDLVDHYIGTSLTHIPSGYRIALLGSWLTARYAIPENKPSRTACAQMAIDRLVAQYGSRHLLDRLNCKPVINEATD